MVGLVLGLDHRDFYIQRSQCSGRTPIKGLSVSRDTLDILRELVRLLRGIACYQKGCLHFGIKLIQVDQGATMGITSGGEEITLLSGMGVPPNEVLDTSESLHLTIGYLLRGECRDLRSQSWLAKVMY